MVPLRRALPALLALLGACGGGGAEGGAYVAYVTNGVDPFWTLAEAGARAAEAELGVRVDVRMPADAVDQKRIVEDLLARGVDGLAISPIDGANQRELVDAAAAVTNVITHDSDAPGSARLCYVGMDNYEAGRLCGSLIQEALPEGGTVMLFVGRLEQDNARRRRQGILDQLLDREPDPARFDPPGEVPRDGPWIVLDTRTDQFERPRAKSNAEDALALHPDLGCMVGLFAYNTPMCLEALAVAGRLGEVAVVGFDEEEATLRGIEAGHVHGTITQQPYQYGYQSVRILAALHAGDRSVLPADGFVPVPVRVVRRADVAAFREDLRRLLGR